MTKLNDKFYKEYYEASMSGITKHRLEKYTLLVGILKEEIEQEQRTKKLFNRLEFVRKHKTSNNFFLALLELEIIKISDKKRLTFVFEWNAKKELSANQVLTVIMMMKKITHEQKTGKAFSYKDYLPADYKDKQKQKTAYAVKKKNFIKSEIRLFWGLIRIPIRHYQK